MCVENRGVCTPYAGRRNPQTQFEYSVVHMFANLLRLALGAMYTVIRNIIKFFVIISSNIDRFQKFFHRNTPRKICKNRS